MILSIITINYNNAHGLEQTIKSVFQQSFGDYEYIVIDGGSTDNSVNIIKQYESEIDYWLSEKDKGVYHAMNKGISKATGIYLLMLNSGDALINESILSKVFCDGYNKKADILYGNIEWQNNGVFFSKSDFPHKLDAQYFWQRSISHQAAFIKKSAHSVSGLYDEGMKINADWKFFLLALAKDRLTFEYLPYTVAIGDNTGISWNQANYFRIEKERAGTIKKYFESDYKAYKQLKALNKPSFRIRLSLLKQQIKNLLKTFFKIFWKKNFR